MTDRSLDPLGGLSRRGLPARVGLGILLAASALTLLSCAGDGNTLERGSGDSEEIGSGPAPCMVELPQGEIEGSTISCGYLTVPETYDEEDPEGAVLQLAVAVLHATGPDPRPDPVVWAQGGPGGSTLEDLMLLASMSPLRADRDMVLFDQRGTGYSKPSLNCPEDDEDDLSLPEASAACRDRLVSQGVDLAAFNSVNNAADVEFLRQALGYKQINLYGVSYGSELALNVMRAHPGGLRSVILDGVVPTDVNTHIEYPRSMDRAFTEFFEACSEDPGCRLAYPDLEGFFFSLVERLDEKPAAIRLVDFSNRRGHDETLDGEGMLSFLFKSLYMGELVPYLPMAIHDVSEGDYAALEALVSVEKFEQELYEGMYLSVECSDSADFEEAEVAYEGVRAAIAKRVSGGGKSWLERCRDWGVHDLGGWMDRPVRSSIPALLMSGRFDPITPPEYAERAARTLSKSTVVTFPNASHGAVDSSECAREIVREFVDDPSRAPDTSCVEAIPKLDFLTPGEVIRLPMLDTALSVGEGNRATVAALIVFAAGSCLALLPMRVLDWEIRWWAGLIRWRRKLRAVLRRRRRTFRRRPSLISRWAPTWSLGILVLALGGLAIIAYARVLILGGSTREEMDAAVASVFWRWIYAALWAGPTLVMILGVGIFEGLAGRLWSRRRKANSVSALAVGIGLLVWARQGWEAPFWTVYPLVLPAAGLLLCWSWRSRTRISRLLDRWDGRRGRDSRPRARILRASGIVLTLSMVAQLAFAWAFLMVLVALTEADLGKVIVVFLGIPSWGKWVLLPLWLIAGSAILQAVFTVAMLREPGWSIWRKALYVIASAVGLTLMGLLASSGAMVWPF